MVLVLAILFTLSVMALFHTYVFYPWLVRRLAERQPPIPDRSAGHFRARVSVLMAVFNEERVLESKLESLRLQDYENGPIDIWIGSDCSTDATNDILNSWAKKDPRIRPVFYQHRQGKPGIINDLAQRATPPAYDHIFVITDASVLLGKEVITRLVGHFTQPQLAIVDTHMVPVGLQSQGISRSESTYLNREVLLKHWEGRAWRSMIGPFGGCYALRSTFFAPVPSTFLVDDFYICMRAFEQGGEAISDLKAVCHEAVGQEIGEEFRRKKRISAGNIQNLITFRHLWWPPFGQPNFAFFSHKILRWMGPIWLLLIWLSSAGLLLFLQNFLTAVLFLLVSGVLMLVPLLDVLLQQLGINLQPLRHIRYFMVMNIALLAGYLHYAKGVRTNVWQPPKRS